MIIYDKIEDRNAYCACCTHDAGQDGIYDISETVDEMPVVKVVFSLEEKTSDTPRLYIPRCVEDIEIKIRHNDQDPIVIEISPENPYFMSDGDALYTKDMSRLIVFLARNKERFEIPESVRTIARGVFGYTARLREVIVPEGLEEIEENAFYMSAVKKIDLKNVKKLGKMAFYGCKVLDNIRLTCKKIPMQCFCGCVSLRSVILENTKRIGCQAFMNAPIKRAELPGSLREMDGNAFQYGAETVVLPGGVLEINGDLYAGTAEITFSEDSVFFSDRRDDFSTVSGTALAVRSENGEILCEVMTIDSRRSIFSFCDLSKKSGFDLERYDAELLKEANHYNYYNIAAADFRLDKPYELSEDVREGYRKYISEFADTYIDVLIDHNEMDKLAKFVHYDLLSEETFLWFVELSVKRKMPELTALLLQKRKGGR